MELLNQDFGSEWNFNIYVATIPYYLNLLVFNFQHIVFLEQNFIIC